MDTTIYLIGEAKAPGNNPITAQYGLFFVGVEADTVTHTIVRAECTATLDLTKTFVSELLTGRSLLNEDDLASAIAARYHGSSQKALIAAMRSACAKYRDLTAGGAS